MKGGSSNTSGVYLYLQLQLKKKKKREIIKNNRNTIKKKTKLPFLLPKDIQIRRAASQGEQTPFVVCDWMPNI